MCSLGPSFNVTNLNKGEFHRSDISELSDKIKSFCIDKENRTQAIQQLWQLHACIIEKISEYEKEIEQEYDPMNRQYYASSSVKWALCTLYEIQNTVESILGKEGSWSSLSAWYYYFKK